MLASPADLHRELQSIELLPAVPDHIRRLFDTARNLSLCTWYVYEFHSIAELTGFLALEAALKARAQGEAPAVANEKSFRKLLQHAVKARWITEERIAHRREIARIRVEQRKVLTSIRRMDELGLEQPGVEDPTEEEISAEEREMKILHGICEAAINFRNSLAHGEAVLAPGSYVRLRMTADLINQLYSQGF